jgi:hypothetical protein
LAPTSFGTAAPTIAYIPVDLPAEE